MEKIKQYLQQIKVYVTSASGKELLIGIGVIIAVIGLIVAVIVFIQNAGPKIDYQPSVACQLLTKDEASEMLGDRVIDQNKANPTLQDNVATSKCSYTDTNTEQDKMLVAAVAVRSGVTDQGVEKNKREFAAAKRNDGMQPVDEIGEEAFFNPELGQLNIRHGRDWIIVSYGTGANQGANTLENDIELAQKILPGPELPKF